MEKSFERSRDVEQHDVGIRKVREFPARPSCGLLEAEVIGFVRKESGELVLKKVVISDNQNAWRACLSLRRVLTAVADMAFSSPARKSSPSDAPTDDGVDASPRTATPFSVTSRQLRVPRSVVLFSGAFRAHL